MALGRQVFSDESVSGSFTVTQDSVDQFDIYFTVLWMNY